MTPSLLLATFSFLSRALGLIEKPLLASHFGAGSELDAYFAAFRIPDFIFNLLVLGVITVSFIPLLTPFLEQKKIQQAQIFASSIFNRTFLILTPLLILLWIFTPHLLPLFTENFTPETSSLAISLTRIMLLSPLLFALSAILGSICNAHHKFLPYALAPVFYKLGIIFGIIFLSPHFGIKGVAFGVLIGAFAHFLTNLPSLFRLHWRWTPTLFLEKAQTKIILKMSLPRIFSLGATQLNLFIDTFLATSFAAGSLTLFNFADSVGNLPVGIIGLSVAVASFPLLSKFAHHQNNQILQSFISQKLLQLTFLLLPLTIATIFLREEIMSALFNWGSFDPNLIPRASLILAAFSLSFVPASFIPLLTRVFFAHHKIKAPLLGAILVLFSNAALAISFIKLLHLDVWALGLAFSISSFLHATFLLLSFYFTFGKNPSDSQSKIDQILRPQSQLSFLPSLSKIILLQIPLFLFFWFTSGTLPNLHPIFQLLIFGGGGTLIFLILAHLAGLTPLFKTK